MKKITSLFLALCLVFSLTTSVFATSRDEIYTEGEKNVSYESGNVSIKTYNTPDGSLVFAEYHGGILAQRYMVLNDGSIEYEIFKEGEADKGTISPSDYGTVYRVPVISPNAGAVSAGTINYRALYGGSYVYYGARCSYTSKVTPNTFFETDGFKGSLVKLASVIASSFGLSTGDDLLDFLVALCQSAGITISGGMLQEKLDTTLACSRTDYDWTCVDTTNSNNYAKFSGTEFVIRETNSSRNGETIYEGYTPKDRGNRSFAGEIHSELFDYVTWEIVSWS